MNKVLITLIIFCFVAIGAVGYVTWQNSPSKVFPSVSPTGFVVSPDLVYHNTKYGFTLSLLPTWEKYKATTYENQNRQDRSICFSFENNPSQGSSICIFQIYIYTKAEWGIMTKKPIFIAENSQYIFSYDYDKNCVQASTFECERIKEVPQIITTFAFKKL